MFIGEGCISLVSHLDPPLLVIQTHTIDSQKMHRTVHKHATHSPSIVKCWAQNFHQDSDQS